MSKRKITVLVAAFLCSLLLAGAVLANGLPSVDWQVTGGGGGHFEQGIYTLDNTIGQPVVGTDSTGIYDLCAGFWCRPEEYEIYLPVVLRNGATHLKVRRPFCPNCGTILVKRGLLRPARCDVRLDGRCPRCTRESRAGLCWNWR
jgi:ribosomal protein S27AE